ncbi:hypothetical protein [Ilyobacter polytropus]|uniref:Uncharacterized protein n=1 Tax=Ilyobacter polytropus (strain ATCC 51220 / DSM 2926 / LMG 16218 / CuHBu1) TaxID=572544 RepID=E3HAJ0_ILYPC|nr:hypothetical protein [Ilyobacter polytropus]ADO83177.1 hypothetical protein Ilyop_1397 [Ilyobacter polytropus DSM 2926]
MYNVKISEKNYDLADFYEVSKILKKFEGPRDGFPVYFSNKLKEFFEDTYLTKGDEDLEKDIYKTQLLINDCFDYLFSGEGDFEKYFDEKARVKYKESLSSLRKHKTKVNVCYEPEVVAQKLESENDLDLFYYYSFTLCYLNEYLIQLFSIFKDRFQGGSLGKIEVKSLNDFLMNIFTVEYEKAFVEFEKEIIKSN